MNRRSTLGFVCTTAIVAAAGALVFAGEPAKHAGKDGQPALPPGMTEADMQACMEAGTPGEMHKWLTESVGVWQGTCKHWMAPGTEAATSSCTCTIAGMMDGRFIKSEFAGDMPGMGPFSGFGISGFDNVSKKFQSTWVDNMGTGMMVGTGDRSSDGSTLTWTYTYNCPMKKKPTTMREVDRRTGKDSFTLEMFGPDMQTGKEFKMMEITFTRKPGSAAVPAKKN